MEEYIDGHRVHPIRTMFIGTNLYYSQEFVNDIINEFIKILHEHIDECREELNIIMKSYDLDYINECSKEFNVIRKNIEMIIEKVEELRGE